MDSHNRAVSLVKPIVLICMFLVLSVSNAGVQNQAPKVALADNSLPSFGLPSPLGQSSGSFVMASSSLNYTFRDDFNYANVSAMVGAGWVMCGNGPASYYQV